MQLSFRRLMIGPSVSVLIECKPDEPKHDQDGSGHHHPMGVDVLTLSGVMTLIPDCWPKAAHEIIVSAAINGT